MTSYRLIRYQRWDFAYVDLNEVAAVNRGSLSVFFPALLVACSQPTDTIENIEQRYLFEIEYVNHAWGLAWNGLVIDGDGDIYAYDHGDGLWEPASLDLYTETELEDKYEHESRYIGRIDAATIAQQFGRISSVGDHFSNAQRVCADAGSLTYHAFRYEAVSGRYRPLLLREEGDSPRSNLSDAAENLAAWLRSLVLTLEDAGVTPFSKGMCTP